MTDEIVSCLGSYRLATEVLLFKECLGFVVDFDRGGCWSGGGRESVLK